MQPQSHPGAHASAQYKGPWQNSGHAGPASSAAPPLPDRSRNQVMPEPPRAPPGNPDYPVRLLQGHRRRVCTVGWSCNGKKLASGSEDQTVKIWAVEPAVTVRSSQHVHNRQRTHRLPIANRLHWHTAAVPGLPGIIYRMHRAEQSREG